VRTLCAFTVAKSTARHFPALVNNADADEIPSCAYAQKSAYK
jgi:hypothetical protein